MTGWAATNTLREIAEFHRQGADFCSQIEQSEKHERYAEYLALVEAALDAADKVVAHYALDRVSYEDYEALAAALRAVREAAS